MRKCGFLGWLVEHSPGTCTSHNFPEGGATASFDSGLPRHLAAEVAGIFNIYKLRLCYVTGWFDLKE